MGFNRKSVNWVNETTDINESIGKDNFTNLKRETANELKENYYGVVDNISGLIDALKFATMEDPAFSAEYKAAKKMHDIFKKSVVGKYL